MISRSLLIAGTCLVTLVVCAGCVVAPYRGAYLDDDGPYFYPKRYHDDHNRGDWHDEGRWRRHRHHHHD
jgi:hypothetical protein